MKNLVKLPNSTTDKSEFRFRKIAQGMVILILGIFAASTTVTANDGSSVIKKQNQPVVGGYNSRLAGIEYSQFIRVFPGEKRPETICPQKPVSTDELELFNDNSCLHCLSNEGCAWTRIESQCNTQEGIPLPASLPCKIAGSGGSLITENMSLIDCYNLDGTPLMGELQFIPVPHCQQ